MILTYIIDMDGMLRLTEGQGQKVKGQGHTYIYGYFFVSAINHELMNGS